MQKKILIFVLSAVTLIISFFAWRSVGQAITVPGASQWIASIIWFTLLFAVFCLDIILIREAYVEALIFVFSTALSFIFTQSIGHLLAFVLA